MKSIWQSAYNNAQDDANKRLSQTTAILNQLVANGSLSRADANKILTALANLQHRRWNRYNS